MFKGTATGRKSHNYDFFTIFFAKFWPFLNLLTSGDLIFLYIHIFFKLHDFSLNFVTKNWKISLEKYGYTINFRKTLCVEGGLGHREEHRK